MKFRPLHDRVVVRRVESDRRPPAASSSPTPPGKADGGRGHRRGPGARDEAGKLVAIDVKAGDRILFGKWSGTEVKIDGVEF
jgi:chaperonin GroES